MMLNFATLHKGAFLICLELFGAIHWYNIPPWLGLFYTGIVIVTIKLPVLLN